MPAAPYRVLLVEDEFLIGELIADMLDDLGHQLAATVGQVEDALHAARTGEFDLALLDLRLRDGLTYPIADALAERGIPFAFVTGYGSSGIDAAHAAAPVLQKPFRRADLAAIIARLMPGG